MERLNFKTDPEQYGARQVTVAQVLVDERLQELMRERFHPYWDNEFGAVFGLANVFACKPRLTTGDITYEATATVILYAEGFPEKDWHIDNLEAWLRGKEKVDNSNIDFWFLMRRNVLDDPEAPNDLGVWCWDKAKFYEAAFDKAMDNIAGGISAGN